ncbi:MAG: chitobiase/beta-hexosaminidase C-terminal domain-containing protein [Terracidiphilus sp.]
MQAIALTDLTPSASIYYTTNGSNPTTSSPRYTSSIHIDSLTTVKAMAIAIGYAQSATAQASFDVAATPEFTYIASAGSVAAQADGATQLVAMTDKTPGAIIYYTTDGTVPSTSSKRYTRSLTMPVSATIKAFAAAPDLINSPATIAPEIAWPAPAPITFGEALTRRQLDASSPIMGTFAYTPRVGTVPGVGDQRLTVTFTPRQPADYANATKIVPFLVNRALLTITAVDEDAFYGKPIPRLRYTIQGFVDGDRISVLRGAPAVTTNAKNGARPGVYRIAIAVGTLSAENYSFRFHDGLFVIIPLGRVAQPAFSLAAGTYHSAQTVKIMDEDKGSTIYYAVHGNTPTTASTRYTGPINVDSTETIKAIAVKNGYSDSSVATVKYTISPTPALGFVAGCANAGVGFALRCAPAVPPVKGNSKRVSQPGATSGGDEASR